MDSVVVNITKSELYGKPTGGKAASIPTIFVAFRMQDAISIEFRKKIQIELERSRDVRVIDGRAEPGRPWLKHIKTQIKKSKIVIADVTGPSREVIFEFGVAGGKPHVPVVETASHRSTLPRWLTSMQITSFEDGSTRDVSDYVLTKLSDPKLRGFGRPPPIPGKVVWLQYKGRDWPDEIFESFSNLCQEQGLTLEQLYPSDLESFDDVTDALRAWLFVGCIDGRDQDYAAHFFAGDIFSRAMCGAGPGKGEKIQRKMIFVGRNNDDIENYVADSIKRVPSNLVRCTTNSEFISAVKRDLKRHKTWISGGHK